LSSKQLTKNFIPYSFNTKEVFSQSLIHLINIHFDDLIVGVEVGSGTCTSLLTLLDQCPKIKTMYAIDSYSPYVNFLKEFSDDVPSFIADEKYADYTKLTGKHNVKYSNHEDKVIFIEEESLKSVKKFEDNSIDFIFLDSYFDSESIKKDIESWYPKIKVGGLISGHDWVSNDLQNIVNQFRANQNIKNTLSHFDNVWVWKK
jgi:hypothetical protein